MKAEVYDEKRKRMPLLGSKTRENEGGIANEQTGVEVVVSRLDICRTESLPNHHADPFDRLLIAQAIEIGAIAVTDDARWLKYPVKLEF